MKIRDLLQQVSDPRGCGGKTVDPMGKAVVVDFKPDPCWFLSGWRNRPFLSGNRQPGPAAETF